MGMTGAAKKTGYSIGRCPTLIRLQYSQQYQSQWTLSCLVFWQMGQSYVFDFFLESQEMGARSMGWSGSSLRSRTVFLFGLNMAVGTHFTVIVGFTMGVRGLFMEENLANGVLEKAWFCFHWVCFGQGALEKRMWVKGALPFLLICWAMSRCCCRRVREEKMLLVMYLSTGLVKRSIMIGWRSLHSRICLRQVCCCSGSIADLVEREEVIL